jgi:hypothetical protein
MDINRERRGQEGWMEGGRERELEHENRSNQYDLTQSG